MSLYLPSTHVDYCSNVLHYVADVHLHMLQSVLKAAACLIIRKRKRHWDTSGQHALVACFSADTLQTVYLCTNVCTVWLHRISEVFVPMSTDPAR